MRQIRKYYHKHLQLGGQMFIIMKSFCCLFDFLLRRTNPDYEVAFTTTKNMTIITGPRRDSCNTTLCDPQSQKNRQTFWRPLVSGSIGP